MSTHNLIYGENYFCYVGNECLGTATFVNDPFIGDSFSRLVVHSHRGLQEEIIMPEWVLRAEC